LDTVLAADRIKRLQGKEVADKSLDYWSDKKKEDENIEEKEALIKKYVTTPKTAPASKTQSSGMSRGKIYLLIFLIAAFFVGTGYGVYVMSMPSDDASAVIMTVNDSAFPFVNNTTLNQTTTNQNTTKTTVVKRNTTSPTRNTTTNTNTTK
jgi:hypothetical protein